MDEPPEAPQQTEEVPARCPRCSADLVACRGNMPLGAAGALLAVAGLAASGFLLLRGRTEWLPAGVAAFIFGIEMTGDRTWWECPECGRQFTRLPPPYTADTTEDETGPHEPPDAQEHNPEAD